MPGSFLRRAVDAVAVDAEHVESGHARNYAELHPVTGGPFHRRIAAPSQGPGGTSRGLLA